MVASVAAWVVMAAAVIADRVPGDSPVEPSTRARASAVTGAVHLFNAEGVAVARIESRQQAAASG
jgi:hypothetical protein